MTDAIVSSPVITQTRIKPQKLEVLRAFKAFRRLMSNKEDTRQVFEIMQALNGKSTSKAYRRLISTLEGGRLAYQRTELAPLFDNRAFTGRFPIGTIGHAYRVFMDSENLSADGLAEVSRQARGSSIIDVEHPVAWFGRRIRDTHDIWHILTGYHRDGLGELCLVAFSYAQTKSLGWAFIAIGGALRALQEPGGMRAVKAVWQAYRNGCKAAWLPGEDFEALMGEPLTAARVRLNIAAPSAYQAIPEHLRDRAAALVPA
jgi:ubiquinone biosynthesis protein COQ4